MHIHSQCRNTKVMSADQFWAKTMLDCAWNYAFLKQLRPRYPVMVSWHRITQQKIILCKSSYLYKLQFEPFFLQMQAYFIEIFDLNVWRQRLVSILYISWSKIIDNIDCVHGRHFKLHDSFAISATGHEIYETSTSDW